MVPRTFPSLPHARDDHRFAVNAGSAVLFQGRNIVQNPLTILWIAIPLSIQTVLVFALGYGLSKVARLTYENAAPTAMIGASNHFEVAIATATMLYGLSSGAALATVVGVLIEVPLMLLLVKFCLGTQNWFHHDPASGKAEAGVEPLRSSLRETSPSDSRGASIVAYHTKIDAQPIWPRLGIFPSESERRDPQRSRLGRYLWACGNRR